MVSLATKLRDPYRSDAQQAETDLLSLIWDHLMEERIKTHEFVIEIGGMRMTSDSHKSETELSYTVTRLKEDREYDSIWRVTWSRYSFSFSGSFEEYEKDLVLLKMFTS